MTLPSRETVLAEAEKLRDTLRLKATDTVPTHGTILCIVGPALMSKLADDAERLVSLLRQQEDPPALVAFMTGATREERSAAFLRTYAERLRNGTAASWEIPNTVASTLEDIAALLQSARQQEKQVQQIVEKWREDARQCRLAAARDGTTQGYDRKYFRGIGYDDCADQLSALLRSDGATTP